MAGHGGEAYCKCRVCLRTQKHDLKKHFYTRTHKEKALALNLTKQKCLMDSGKQFKIIIFRHLRLVSLIVRGGESLIVYYCYYYLCN